MANKRAFDVASVRGAIEKAGASPQAIADALGCARGTVYSYLRKYPELKEAFERSRGGAVAEKAQFTKEAFVKAMSGSRGIKTVIASRLGCSRQTVDNALERWPELVETLNAERESIVDLAEAKLLNAVNNDELRAIIFTLETLGKDRGWTKRTEVTGADGAGLLDLSPEVVRLVAEMGLDMSEVVRQFEGMVKLAAMQKERGE